MKKTLLCFIFLLFSNLFYSQAGDLVNCAGVTTFNLLNSRSLLLGTINQVPADIRYYESLENASNNVNAIQTPSQYVSTAPSKTIYARIEYNGAVTTNYFNLIVADPLTASLQTNMVTCAGEKNGSVVVNTSGGKAPFTYKLNWQTVQNTNVFNNLSGGYYSIIVTDALGCETTVETYVTEPVMLTIYPLIQNQKITAFTSGGTLPYQYSLDGSVYQPNNIFDNVAPGNHLLWTRDANGCVTQKTVTVSAVSTVVAAVTATPINCNNPAAVVTITASGGQPPYAYSIDNGLTYNVSNIFSNVFPGLYYIKVKDTQNYETTVGININPAPVLTVAASVTKNIDCVSLASINASAAGGTAPYVYSINGSPFQSSNAFPNLASGVYHITVKDAQNCTSITNEIVIDPIIPLSAVINQTADYCSSSSIVVTASGGQSPYLYSFDGGATYRPSNSYSAFPGLYSVIVRDANGCQFNTQFVSESPFPLTITSSLTDNEDCDGNRTLTVTTIGGTAPYVYSIGNGYQAGNTFYNVLAGNYTVSVQDSKGCIKNMSLSVTPPNVLKSTISIKNAICNGSATGEVTVMASGGFSPYTYSLNGAAFVSTNVFNNLTAGSYTVTVKDAKGCNRSHYLNIAEPNSLAMNIDVITETQDEYVGARITPVSTGGTAPYTYNIKNNVTGEIVAQNEKIIAWSGFKPGSYTFTVIDSNGCTFENNNVNIVIQSPIILNAVRTPTTCTNNFASLSINPSGGVAPYLYSYDKGATYTTSNTGLSNLSTGFYTIYVKDAAGSRAYANISVKPYEPVAIVTTTTNTNCYGSNDGTLIVNAAGGVAPYTYSIGNEYSTSKVFNNLAAGDYILNVRDAAGCITTANVKIGQPDFISYQISITNSTTVNSRDARIVIVPYGGTAPYLYSLQSENGVTLIPFQPSSNLANLLIGTYNVLIKDSKGCLRTVTRVNLASTILTATAVVTPVTCTSPGTITINTVGKIPAAYSFNGNNYTPSNVAHLPSGTYNIKIKDVQNNITTIYATIPALNRVIIPTAVISEIDCNGSNNAVIKAPASGGKAPYTYKLNNGSYQGSDTFSNLSPGTYQIGVKDSNQCTYIKVITITEPAVLASNVEITDNKITVNTTGGTAPYTYELVNETGSVTAVQTSNIFNDVPAGTYLVKVKDARNCTSVYNGISISETAAPSTTGKTSSAVQITEGPAKSVLTAADFTDFRFYPNPVENIVTVNNTSIIDEVQILSVSGNSILIKKINNTQSEIDLSNLSTGIYILKVTSQGKEKTTKIIKK
ncbi:T9SS type A sorting domain-containing protein [Flavobacterium reichenbachii]|uniref:Secretion system C-terminal sorting domain-containing protein n=1 Tax=Flavobacterium reichenbachii TaxID=362418 RepID=A0A085ZRZ5_9FLAO|nr:T9SS type A sorting domain-containing protein [Flavobacterium reichenbachii]KFF07209.1 hypothetical protein IW19_17610 [Flavobacterium reichenbachii]OXB13299.1 T9SS C-terminal target domain-containing protein [Flavobacterium reichenbachii]